MTALTDPSSSLYIILGTIVVVLGALWFRNRTRSSLIQFAIGAGLLALVFLIDSSVESPREEAVRRIQEMAAATRNRNLDNLLRHVHDSFRSKSWDRAGLGNAVRRAQERSEWAGAEAWSFERDAFRQIDDNTIEIGFLGQASGFPQTLHWCVAVFKEQSNGSWLLTGLRFYDPLQREKGAEKTIPEL
jgi:hypothetical protein